MLKFWMYIMVKSNAQTFFVPYEERICFVWYIPFFCSLISTVDHFDLCYVNFADFKLSYDYILKKEFVLFFFKALFLYSDLALLCTTSTLHSS